MKTVLATSILLNIAAIVAGTATQGTEESSKSATRVPDLQARNYVGEHYCGHYANADAGNVNGLLETLGGEKKNHEYHIGARGCHRVACHNTSGVYVCNDNHFELTVNGHDVASAAAYINKHCCYSAGVSGLESHSIRSGQQFTQWGWNVVIGYADCNAGVTLPPSDAGGWGVNPGTCPAARGMTNENSDW